MVIVYKFICPCGWGLVLCEINGALNYFSLVQLYDWLTWACEGFPEQCNCREEENKKKLQGERTVQCVSNGSKQKDGQNSLISKQEQTDTCSGYIAWLLESEWIEWLLNVKHKKKRLLLLFDC